MPRVLQSRKEQALHGALTAICCALVIMSTEHRARADARDGRLDIYFIDVEGGAVTLLVTPAGESLLIDSGYPDNNGRDRLRVRSE